MMNLKDTYAGVDPILTTLAQGYMLPETNIANFIAPVVDTPTRAGRTLRFGKEAFAISDYRRAYGTTFLLSSLALTAIHTHWSKKSLLGNFPRK